MTSVLDYSNGVKMMIVNLIITTCLIKVRCLDKIEKALFLIALCLIATVMAQTHMDRERDLDSFSVKWNSRGVTQSQKDEVAKNQAYRNNLNEVNAKWQADSQNKLNHGQQPDQFPEVPPPDSKAPTA